MYLCLKICGDWAEFTSFQKCVGGSTPPLRSNFKLMGLGMKVKNIVQKVYVEIDGHNFEYDRYSDGDWWKKVHDYSSVTAEESNKLEEAHQTYLKKLEEEKEPSMKEYTVVKTSTYSKDGGIVCPKCDGTGNLPVGDHLCVMCPVCNGSGKVVLIINNRSV